METEAERKMEQLFRRTLYDDAYVLPLSTKRHLRLSVTRTGTCVPVCVSESVDFSGSIRFRVDEIKLKRKCGTRTHRQKRCDENFALLTCGFFRVRGFLAQPRSSVSGRVGVCERERVRVSDSMRRLIMHRVVQ